MFFLTSIIKSIPSSYHHKNAKMHVDRELRYGWRTFTLQLRELRAMQRNVLRDVTTPPYKITTWLLDFIIISKQKHNLQYIREKRYTMACL